MAYNIHLSSHSFDPRVPSRLLVRTDTLTWVRILPTAEKVGMGLIASPLRVECGFSILLLKVYVGILQA